MIFAANKVASCYLVHVLGDMIWNDTVNDVGTSLVLGGRLRF